MELIGNLILYIIMLCCALGALATIFKEESGLAQSFHDGIGTMAALFIPICGLMVSIPYIIKGVQAFVKPVFSIIGADPVVAVSFIAPPDAGGYALALSIGQSPAIMVICMAVGFMVASTVAFNIPIGLSVLEKKDQNFLALGAMSGFLAAPFGISITYLLVYFTEPMIRTTFTTVGDPDYKLQVDLLTLFVNLIPIALLCVLLAVGLRVAPAKMIKGFKIFGKCLISILTLIVMVSVVNHYTGLFSMIFKEAWIFDPLFADEKESFRAIELLGTIAMMLTGAFPMVYLIRTYCHNFLTKVGKVFGLGAEGSAGLIACLANGLALFPLVNKMSDKDKILSIAFMICAGYSLGDFIAFNVNFQPNLVVPILLGQLSAGVIGIFFAKWLVLPNLGKLNLTEASSVVLASTDI